MIAIAHPERQHSHQLAAALHQAGMLEHYFYGAGIPSNALGLLPPARHTKHSWFLPLRRSLKFVRPVSLQRRLFLETLQAFDRQIAAKLQHLACSAVVAYECSALATFQMGRNLGITNILDAASVHHSWQSKWSADSNTKHSAAIKDAEIELADLIITSSKLSQESYAGAGVAPNKIICVSLGIDVVQFQPLEGLADDTHCVRFLFAGHLTHHKGIDLLAEACQRLSSSSLPFGADIAGDLSSCEAEILQKLTGVARLHGTLPHERMPALFRSADVLVLPSRFDAFGMVVTEALACGLPVIVSGNVGAKDLISDGVNGWVVPAGNAEALTQRMAWCARNVDAVRSMRPAARATAEAHTWEVYRTEIAQKLETFLTSHRAPASLALRSS